MLALTEKQTLIRALGQVIADKVRDELAPFRKQMADLQATISALPAPQAIIDHTTNVVENLCATWAPIPGKDGKDFDPSVIAPAIADELNARRANGLVVDLETVMEKARALVADTQIDIQEWASNYIEEQLKANLPKVRDGKDGKDFDPSVLNDAILDQLNFHRANGMIVGLDTVMEKARSLVTDAEIDIQKWTAAYITEQFEKCLPKVRDGIDGKDGKDGGSSLPSPDFMTRLRAAEARARERPDPLQPLVAAQAALRDDIRELTSLMRLLIDGVERLVRAQRRRKASKDKLAQ